MANIHGLSTRESASQKSREKWVRRSGAKSFSFLKLAIILGTIGLFVTGGLYACTWSEDDGPVSNDTVVPRAPDARQGTGPSTEVTTNNFDCKQDCVYNIVKGNSVNNNFASEKSNNVETTPVGQPEEEQNEKSNGELGEKSSINPSASPSASFSSAPTLTDEELAEAVLLVQMQM